MTNENDLRNIIKMIDEETNDLLDLADVLEEHNINVKLDNGRYLNPVSTIRTKVDVIWDEVMFLALEARRAVSEE